MSPANLSKKRSVRLVLGARALQKPNKKNSASPPRRVHQLAYGAAVVRARVGVARLAVALQRLVVVKVGLSLYITSMTIYMHYEYDFE